jgi:hypothetical protein
MKSEVKNMEIKQTSKVILKVDTRIVDQTFSNTNEAWEKAVNLLMQGKHVAIIRQDITLERK